MFYASPGFGTMAQAQSTNSAAPESQQILIRMGDETVTATLIDSEATRDFVAMLPLSIRVNDHMRREKTGVYPGRCPKIQNAFGLTRSAMSPIGRRPNTS
jgi:hypothetical protein